jgi:hypothetical protein
MLLVMPTLLEGINSKEGREAFKSECHMFYQQRVVDFRGDGVKKWKGLEGDSEELNEDGEEINGKEEKKE